MEVECKSFFYYSKGSLILTSKILGWSEDVTLQITEHGTFLLTLQSRTLFEGTEIG